MRRFVGVVGFFLDDGDYVEMLVHHVRAWTADRALKKIWKHIRTHYDPDRYRVRYIEVGTIRRFWSDDPMACRFIGLQATKGREPI